MMMPPKQDDLAARMDPSKQRARGFNTGKGAKTQQSGGDDSSAWYETAEQKQKRLADEMMGIARPSGIGPSKPSKTSGATKADAAAQKIREHTVRKLCARASVRVLLTVHRRRLEGRRL